MSLLRIIPLGGAGEIGKNCTVVEVGDDLILIDCGLSFPHEEHFGVDIVIPDFKYLIDNKHRLKAVFITHAHEDHVGALSFFVTEFNVPIYCTPFTEAMVRSKLEERVKLMDVNISRMMPRQVIKVTPTISVEPVQLTHSIPEMCALAINTPHGYVIFTGDFKFDPTPIDGKVSDIDRLKELGEAGVVCLLSDSTNVDRPGWGPSESAVTEGYRSLFSTAKGRILITMFSSNIHRMQQAIDVAKETGKRIAVAGRRMDGTVQMCIKLGYITMPRDVYIPIEEIGKLPHDKVVVLVTGSQGEPMAALSQMSRSEYSRMRVLKGDTILYSARPIPGNEGGIWRTVNRLVKMGAEVITDHDTPIHVSGHAYQEEIKEMIKLTKPFYLAPVHGEPRHQDTYMAMAREMGHSEHRMFLMENGVPLEIDTEKGWLGKRVASGSVLIDQHGNFVVTEKILGERASLAMDGVIVVSIAADLKKGVLESKPEARARGFSGPASAIEDALDELVKYLAKSRTDEIANRSWLEATIAEVVKRVINRKCQQKPVVIPVLTEI